MKKLFLLLFLLDFVAAQSTESDIVNGLIVPTVVFGVFIYGTVSFLRFPKIVVLTASIVLTAISYILGITSSFSSIISSMGDLASTGVYITLFLLGAFLASRSVYRRKKVVKYFDVRRMNRRQLSQEMSNIEKRMVDLQSKIESIKLQEHNLELQFANNKNPQISKELERIRKLKNELSDSLDILIERREACKRAYAESTS